MATFFTISWFIAALMVILAMALQALTGFGSALILVPLLVLIYDTHTAIELTMIIAFYSLALLSLRVRKEILIPMVSRLFLGSIVGIFCGAYAFIFFEATWLKIIIAFTTLVFSLLLYLNLVPNRSTGFLAETMVGMASGFLGTSVGMPGPPVVLFLNYKGLPKEHFRATVSAYFSLVYLVSIIVLVSKQVLNLQIIIIAVSLLPFALLGNLMGFLIFPRISQDFFQRGIPILVAFLAVYSLVTTFF
ncbi:MAG: sulfite exporter TauE/SafE family protein [Peptococcaceae bacterium]|nr:sulfite exporter TauE/SafE family protein [Peptococcaceae bacterium]